ATLEDREGRTLEATGTVPFRLTLAGDTLMPGPAESAPVNLALRGKDFPIGWVAPFAQLAGVERVEGQFHSDATITGTIGDPRASGSLGLTGGRITIPRQGVDYRQITAAATLSGETVQITQLEARADGTASIRGNIVLTSLNDPELALDATFNEFRALRNEWVRLGLDGNVKLSGHLAEPKAEGSIRLVKTDIYADEVGQGSAAMPVELTSADYAMLESYFGYRPGDAATLRDPLLPWAIDLKLALGGDVWLRKQSTPEMRVLLTGSLDVRKAANDSLMLFGTAEVVPGRSVVEQFGRRFSIDQGTITFNGLVTEWITAIEATYAVPSSPDAVDPDIAITLSVTGEMDSLRLELSSEPALETSDLVSYLATGRPAGRALEGSGESTSLAGRGTALAMGTVAGLLEQQAGEAVGLDVMEIRHGGPEGTVVIAGRYVSPRLYVGFQQPLSSTRSDQSLTEKGPTTRVELEYTLFRWLLINLQAGQSEFRSFFRTRYAF
ncbi:MAG: translocation/assembly module TamB domain-containing protein, partial [Gemmatimonadales bacterium]